MPHHSIAACESKTSCMQLHAYGWTSLCSIAVHCSSCDRVCTALSRSDAKVQAVDRGDSYQWQGPSTWACYRPVPAGSEAHLTTCALLERCGSS